MSVLSNIAARALGTLDGVATRGLVRFQGQDVSTRDRRRACGLVAALVLLLLLVPAGLALIADPALALPLGFGLVLAAFLFGAGLSIVYARADELPELPASTIAPERQLATALCPGLVVFLDPHGKVTALGGRDRAGFQSYLREPAGRPLAEQVHVADRIALLQAIDAVRLGADSSTAELRLERHLCGRLDGQFATIRIDLTPERDLDGTLLSILGHARDIGAEVELRAEAARLAAEAADANEIKSRFLAAVSHELRTPLNAILGFSDILAGEYFGALANERQREYVQLIRQSGGHLLSVVTTMLDMSKIEAGRYDLMMEEFDVACVVAECENMLSLQAREKGVVLTSRIGRGLSGVVADVRAIRQVLINLVGNAIKFTEAGGAIIVDAHLEGNRFVLSVSDTGIGIAADKLDLIGRPFTQVHGGYGRRYEGSGLGLSLVKGLVALHGGEFAVTSRPGEGTMVTVSMPVDGSGGHCPDEEGRLADMPIEFPPRLRAEPRSGLDLAAPLWEKARDMRSGAYNREAMADGAEAKIASA